MSSPLSRRERRVRAAHRRAIRRGVASVLAALLLVATGWVPATAGAAAFDAHLLRAPYLTDLVGLHVLVNWATDRSATTGSLQWGPVSGGTCTLTNTTTATRTSLTVGSLSEYQWKASLTLPATGTYCYRPYLAGTDLLAANASPKFVTQAAAGSTAPFSFGVMGLGPDRLERRQPRHGQPHDADCLEWPPVHADLRRQRLPVGQPEELWRPR